MRLLPVRLRRHEHVDPDLEPRGGVDDLVAAVSRLELALRPLDVEQVLVDRPRHAAARFSSGMIDSP